MHLDVALNTLPFLKAAPRPELLPAIGSVNLQSESPLPKTSKVRKEKDKNSGSKKTANENPAPKHMSRSTNIGSQRIESKAAKTVKIKKEQDQFLGSVFINSTSSSSSESESS